MLNHFADLREAIETVSELSHNLITSMYLFFGFLMYLFNMFLFDHIHNQAIGSFVSFLKIDHNIVSHSKVTIYKHLKVFSKEGNLR